MFTIAFQLGDQDPPEGCDTFTIRELADVVTSGDESEMRRLLNDRGADPALDETESDPTETVPYDLVYDLTLDLTLKQSKVADELNWLLGDRTKRRANITSSLQYQICGSCKYPIGVGWTREEGYTGFFIGHKQSYDENDKISDGLCPGCRGPINFATLEITDKEVEAMGRVYSYLLSLPERREEEVSTLSDKTEVTGVEREDAAPRPPAAAQLPEQAADIQSEVRVRRSTTYRPTLARELTVDEFAQEIGARVETVQAMIQDGLVKVHQRTGKWRSGEWYVLAEEVERLRKGS
jgi:hypothetical protein